NGLGQSHRFRAHGGQPDCAGCYQPVSGTAAAPFPQYGENPSAQCVRQARDQFARRAEQTHARHRPPHQLDSGHLAFTTLGLKHHPAGQWCHPHPRGDRSSRQVITFSLGRRPRLGQIPRRRAHERKGGHARCSVWKCWRCCPVGCRMQCRLRCSARVGLALMRARLVLPLLRPTAPPLALGLVVPASLVAAETLALYPLKRVTSAEALGVVYLLGVLVVAIGWGFWLAAATTLASALALDYFHIPPIWSLRVYEREHVVTLGVFFVV